MVLDADDSAGVFVIFDVRGDDSVDFDFDAVAFASDAVGVPFVSLKGVASALAEGGYALFVGNFSDPDGADEPLATAFVIKSARPVSLGAIDFGLVSEDLVRFDVSAEHEATVGLAGWEEDIAFEDEVRVGLIGDEEEFLVAREVELAIDDFDFSPVVRIVPAFSGLAVEEGGPFFSGRRFDSWRIFFSALSEG